MSFVLLKLISLVLPLRATSGDETTGLDISMHGEEAYLHAEGGSTGLHSALAEPAPRSVESLSTATAHK
jgi:ammonium transporter, Amt family